MAVCHPGHQWGQNRPVCLWGPGADTLWLILVGNGSVLWHAFRVLSGCILLAPLLLDSCCWGCRWSLLKEWCNCSSMWCGCGGLGDGEVCLWGLVEAWGGVSLPCWCPGNWLWHCCALLLLPMLQGCELLNKWSPISHLATSFLLVSAEGDLAWKSRPTSDRDRAVPIVLQSPAFTRYWPSSWCSLAKNWSWHLHGSMLGATSHWPPYSCSATSRISWSVDPKIILTEGCSGAVFWPCWFVAGGDVFVNATVIPSFTLQHHYEITTLTGAAPTLYTELSSSHGVPSLAHPGIADP